MIRLLQLLTAFSHGQNLTNCNYTDWCKDQNWSNYKGYCQVICMLALIVDWLSGGSQGAEYMLELYSSWTNNMGRKMCVSLKKHSIKNHFLCFLKSDFIYIMVGKQVLISCLIYSKVAVNLVWSMYHSILFKKNKPFDSARPDHLIGLVYQIVYWEITSNTIQVTHFLMHL